MNTILRSVAALILLAAPALAQEQKILHVYNWSDYIAEDALEEAKRVMRQAPDWCEDLPLEVDGAVDEARMASIRHIAESLLSNPVIEDFTVEVQA